MCRILYVTVSLLCCTLQCHGLSNCEKPFVKLLKKCYYVEKDLQADAFHQVCQDINKHSDRVTFDSAEELTALGKYLDEQGFSGGNKFWTRGDNLNQMKMFLWQGSLYEQPRNITYANCLPPDYADDENHNNNSRNNCLQLVLIGKQLYTRAAPCEDAEYHLCEMNTKKSYTIDYQLDQLDVQQ